MRERQLPLQSTEHGALPRGQIIYSPRTPSPLLIPERGLEDHESVVEVQASWPVGGDSRFVFRKHFAKYELFKSSAVSVCWQAQGNLCPPATIFVPYSDSFLPSALAVPGKDGLQLS